MTVSPHAALIYTMVLISASDRNMTDAELHRIGESVLHLPVFRGFDADSLIETAKECAVMVNAENGLERTLAVIRAALPASLRETAYALACDVAAADDRLGGTEVRMLDLIGRGLGIDRLTAAAIERAAHARNAVV